MLPRTWHGTWTCRATWNFVRLSCREPNKILAPDGARLFTDPAMSFATNMPSPSGLHALRGGSPRRKFVAVRPNTAGWTPPVAFPQNLSVPFHGYEVGPEVKMGPGQLVASPRRVNVMPVLYGHDGPVQRHRQPFRSSFQCPSPAHALKASGTLFTSGSPRYDATLGRRPAQLRTRVSARRAPATPKLSQRPATADPRDQWAYRTAPGTRPTSAITSLQIPDSDIPPSPRSRFFQGC